MTAHDPRFAREQRRILRWFGFGSTSQGEAHPPDAPGEPEVMFDPRERRRRQLLTDVGRFLLTHRLEVNPYTLAIAHDIITGADQRLARQIEGRVASRETMAERKLVNRATDVPFGKITFSGGIADVLAHASPGEALKAADDALYAAKGKGRNVIVKAGEVAQAEAA